MQIKRTIRDKRITLNVTKDDWLELSNQAYKADKTLSDYLYGILKDAILDPAEISTSLTNNKSESTDLEW